MSRSAVSRAFTPGASVSIEVRERVQLAAEQLGYRVNRLAQSLNKARSNVVGLVGADLHQPFHADLLATLASALLAEGFQCMLLNATNAQRDIGVLIERVLEFRVLAIVVMAGTPPSRIVRECRNNGVSVIVINKPMRGLAVDTVVADHNAGGRLAAELLIKAGCRRLAVVSSGAKTASLTRRLDAFCARAAELGVAARVWQDGPTDYGGGRAAALAMLAEEPLDGAFCVTDLLALGFLDTARTEFGRRVPEDLSVIGFDDIAQAAWAAYRLTTFRQSTEALTAAVMTMLHRRAKTPEAPRVFAKVPVALVARSTVRGLASAEALE